MGNAEAVRPDGAEPAEVVFLCVPTPMGIGGVADMSTVQGVAEELSGLLAGLPKITGTWGLDR